MKRLALVVALLSGAFASEVTASEYVGAESCGSCHEAQYKKWRRSGHAMSLARLTRVQQRDRVCRSCHTMDAQSEDPKLTGVQCESCHGEGQHYAPSYIMRDEVLAKLLGLEAVTESTCMPCHTPDGPGLGKFSFEDKKKDVCHVEEQETKAKAE